MKNAQDFYMKNMAGFSRKHILTRQVTVICMLTFSFVLMMFQFTPPVAYAKDFSLNNIHQDIAGRYQSVKHIAPEKLDKIVRQKGQDSLLILDVRERGEFSVSHLPEAQQVSPGIWHSSFMKKFAQSARDKTVILYCSVGVRSTKLAAYVQKALRENGAKEIYNLEGGIFRWHNEKRHLQQASQKTDFVHPYNKHWGQLVKRKDMIRYKRP